MPTVRGEPVERIGYRVIVGNGVRDLHQRDFLSREWGKATGAAAKHYARKVAPLFPGAVAWVFDLYGRVW